MAKPAVQAGCCGRVGRGLDTGGVQARQCYAEAILVPRPAPCDPSVERGPGRLSNADAVFEEAQVDSVGDRHDKGRAECRIAVDENITGEVEVALDRGVQHDAVIADRDVADDRH